MDVERDMDVQVDVDMDRDMDRGLTHTHPKNRERILEQLRELRKTQCVILEKLKRLELSDKIIQSQGRSRQFAWY